MAKVSGPLFSMDARGQVGKGIVFSIWKGVNYVRGYAIPKTGMDSTQVAVRAILKDASEAWKTGATVGANTINSTYKGLFNTAAAGTAMSGFNLFIKQCIALNLTGTPGSYDDTLAVPASPTA